MTNLKRVGVGAVAGGLVGLAIACIQDHCGGRGNQPDVHCTMNLDPALYTAVELTLRPSDNAIRLTTTTDPGEFVMSCAGQSGQVEMTDIQLIGRDDSR